MSLQVKYTVVVLVISVIGMIVGGWLVIRAYRTGTVGKSKERKLASGNILIALSVAIAGGFLADFLRPVDVDKKTVAALLDALTASSPLVSSGSECLDKWYLNGEVWHYSLTRANGSAVWQVGHPIFSRLSVNRIIGNGVWLNTMDGTRTDYSIEVGCRGKRGFLTFIERGQAPDDIPTIEVYPELPDNIQAQVIGYAVDRTWDEHEVLAPVMISHVPLHGSQDIGPVKDAAVNKQLSQRWRELYALHTGKIHECTVCATLAGP